MDDEEGRSERLQRAIQQLREMDPQEMEKFLNECRMELRYADGYSGEHYTNYLEASKHV